MTWNKVAAGEFEAVAPSPPLRQVSSIYYTADHTKESNSLIIQKFDSQLKWLNSSRARVLIPNENTDENHTCLGNKWYSTVRSVSPEGVVLNPEGFVLSPEGFVLPHFCYLSPEGVVLNPEGFVLSPEGFVLPHFWDYLPPEGVVLLPDGNWRNAIWTVLVLCTKHDDAIEHLSPSKPHKALQNRKIPL